MFTYFKKPENIKIMTNCTVKSLVLFYKNLIMVLFFIIIKADIKNQKKKGKEKT